MTLRAHYYPMKLDQYNHNRLRTRLHVLIAPYIHHQFKTLTHIFAFFAVAAVAVPVALETKQRRLGVARGTHGVRK